MNNNYTLNKPGESKKTSVLHTLKKFLPLLKEEKGRLIIAGLAVLINTGLNLSAPYIIGHTIDTYVITGQYGGVLYFSAILMVIYLCALVTHYIQIMVMGTVGQHVLFNLRNAIFEKIQSLPVAFFNQNKTGDLISRINNDTDKLNTFFSQGLVQFVANGITIVGAGIFILSIHWQLGVASLAPAVFLLIFTQLLSGWIKRKNAINLKKVGGMSAEIAESLEHFKVIVAFNRRDYFRKKFEIVNEENYKSAVSSGIANNTLTPTYGFVSSCAQLIVIAYGLYLISIGSFTLGLLVSFLSYIMRFYDPLRQMAMIWTSFQTALAAWDRIHDILVLKSDLLVEPKSEKSREGNALLEFKNVHFSYPDTPSEVLHQISFALEAGKTYALVGPTGGGKTTTASLMARLYDPTKGSVYLDGKDIRTFGEKERTKKIGFILQEPILFAGTVHENILYGNEEYKDYGHDALEKLIHDSNLGLLLKRFDEGLKTPVASSGGSLSLGQKQLIAFMRAVLRNPDLLILDEATANIDTVTEQLLEEILKNLPAKTTKVIIAHRLNTIENADEIFFVNGGELVKAGSMEHAVDLLLHGKRKS